MNSNRFFKIVQEYMFQIILCLIGIIGVFVSFCISDDRVFSIISGISVSFIASAIVAIGSLIVFRHSSKRKEVCDLWALDGIYELRQEANIPLNEYQDVMKNQIDIIAMGLSSWLNARGDKIATALRHGIQIRIITVHPDSPFLSAIDLRENKMIGTTKQSIESLIKNIQLNYSGQIEIKFYNNLPLDMYFRVDNHLFVGPYLYGKNSQQTITYEYSKGGKGFDYYTNYFEQLWNSQTIPALDYSSVRSYP